MTKGIINRFKVMNVSRGAVLNGHVVATMLGSSIAVAVIIGMGLSPWGSGRLPTSLEWLGGGFGIIAATAFRGPPWLTVAPGENGCKNSGIRGSLPSYRCFLLPVREQARVVPADKMGQGLSGNSRS